MSDNESRNELHSTDWQSDDHESESAQLAPTTGVKHPMLLYTLARIGLLAGSLGIVYLLGARGIMWLIIGFVISALLSYVLLGKLRDQIAAGFGGHFDRLNEQVELEDSEEDLRAADEQSDR